MIERFVSFSTSGVGRPVEIVGRLSDLFNANHVSSPDRYCSGSFLFFLFCVPVTMLLILSPVPLIKLVVVIRSLEPKASVVQMGTNIQEVGRVETILNVVIT